VALEQIQKTTESKLNMIRKINDSLRKQTQNMERFLKEVKEQEKKDKAKIAQTNYQQSEIKCYNYLNFVYCECCIYTDP
jgi:hypothetical protein